MSEVSTGSKRKSGDTESPLEIIDVKEPLLKRTKADQIDVDVSFTHITQTQRLARVRHAVHEIYMSVDDDALIVAGFKEVNTLYESWLEIYGLPDSWLVLSLASRLLTFYFADIYPDDLSYPLSCLV